MHTKCGATLERPETLVIAFVPLCRSAARPGPRVRRAPLAGDPLAPTRAAPTRRGVRFPAKNRRRFDCSRRAAAGQGNTVAAWPRNTHVSGSHWTGETSTTGTAGERTSITALRPALPTVDVGPG